MASNTSIHIHSPTYGSDPTISNTTFVQADPSNFRAVVQKLTGASEDASAQKLPLTLPSRFATQPHKPTTEIGPKKPNFKLQERRHTAKKLELSIGVSQRPNFNFFHGSMSPSPSPCWYVGNMYSNRGSEKVMASPVSPLEVQEEEEERAIAEKGFYLHPISPLTTPRGCDPPQLLPLFPLHSPNA